MHVHCSDGIFCRLDDLKNESAKCGLSQFLIIAYNLVESCP